MTANNQAKTRIVVGVSGGGRTLANLVKHAAAPAAHYEVVGVISSSPVCAANQWAEAAGLPLFVGNFSTAASSQTAAALAPWLLQVRADWIALGGFLKRFPELAPYKKRIINVHPALLPAFGGKGMFGKHVHAAVIATGAPESGATVHWVTPEYDEGAIIAQIRLPVRRLDTESSLAARVFLAECELYPRVLNIIGSEQLPDESGLPLTYNFNGDTP